MKALIKKATLLDARRIAPSFNRYRLFYKQVGDTAGALKFISDRLKNEESVIFIAEDEAGKVVGFTQLYPTFSSQSMQRTWILNDLFVEESSRKAGVASSLIETASKHASHSGAKGLMLCTQLSNRPAQALYEKLGFSPLSEYRWYFLFAENA